MLSKTTHAYAHSRSGDLQLDIYLSADRSSIDNTTPAFIYFHGGGLVAFNREFIPTHIVQSCVQRKWPLISVDYNLLPQAKGEDLVSNICDAYRFVRGNLCRIADKGDGIWENIIVGGNSAGAYMAYQAGLNLEPKPLALFCLYGPGNCMGKFWSSNHIIGNAPIEFDEVSWFLEAPMSAGHTPPDMAFYPESLLDDGRPNPDFKMPVNPEPFNEPAFLYNWLVQENKLPPLVSDIEVPYSSPAWRQLPKTIIIHGTNDQIVPYEAATNLFKAIGSETAILFTVPDAPHAFDQNLLHGDKDLEIVEQAWKALDQIVRDLKRASA